MSSVIPFALKDAPALIETVFPAQKISYEAQRERKAGPAQTLTALGAYWKGRKPLILVRSIILGSLLPQTDNTEKDLEIFEMLMAFHDEGLARRALIQNKLKPKDIAIRVGLSNPWDFFTYSIKRPDVMSHDLTEQSFPLNVDIEGISLRWKNDITEKNKIMLYMKVLDTFNGYGVKANFCKRPEEIDQVWLYESIWPKVSQHYAYLGIKADSHESLVEQLGILRFGHRPKVSDVFSGGGSIPFEAARIGCDVYSSDLNPVACMLTWGGINIIGATGEHRNRIEDEQRKIAAAVDSEIISLNIEHDKEGNRAKAYLYCLETKCPETGWMVPMASSWVISKMRNIIAILVPDDKNKRFDIEIISGVDKADMALAEKGTVQDGNLTYVINGKSYRSPIKTLREDYRDTEGRNRNKLREWQKLDFKPLEGDVFQERLYAIQWITKNTLNKSRKETFFSSVSTEALDQERKVEQILEANLSQWQKDGLVPDMMIEPGDKTNEPIRTRGWKYWHHLFNARQLLFFSILKKHSSNTTLIGLASTLDFHCKLCGWGTSYKWDGGPVHVFTNQALNTQYNYGHYATIGALNIYSKTFNLRSFPLKESLSTSIKTHEAKNIDVSQDIYITDPPYADAVHYHEITEFFISWLRKNPPAPFDQWNWDSRRALAIKGSGDDFRKDMIEAYSAMAKHMPDNGMQCVMFTHQDTSVWSDMVGIFWAAGLQIVAAWYIATETSSELKKGGYVQGTVTLMLRKRPDVEKAGFKNRILPAVRNEVKAQIEQMMHLNDEVENKLGEPVFNDSDLQMAGYAASLKVLTAYTHIGGEDVTKFSLRPRQRGEVTVVDEIVEQAKEAANNMLVPEGLSRETWQRINGIQRFYLRMMDMETSGAAKLDNYQNFAKAFRVEDYTKVMASMTANKAKLKGITDFSSRDLSDNTEFGATWLGKLTIASQQLLADTEPQVVVSQLQADLADFMEIRPVLIDLLHFIQLKSADSTVRDAAEILSGRLKNFKALGQ